MIVHVNGAEEDRPFYILDRRTIHYLAILNTTQSLPHEQLYGMPTAFLTMAACNIARRDLPVRNGDAPDLHHAQRRAWLPAVKRRL